MGTTPKLEAGQVLAIAHAVADPFRFSILQEIAANPDLPSGILHARNRFQPATISHHIRELQRAGLIRTASDGRQSRFTLVRDVWRAYLRTLATTV